MQITITKDNGEVLAEIGASEIGDLDKPVAISVVMEAIRRAWKRDGAAVHGRLPKPRAA